MASDSHFFHIFPGNIIFFSDKFSGFAHDDIGIRIFFHQFFVNFDIGIDHIHACHLFTATCYNDIHIASFDGIGSGGDTLQTGRTETIDGLCADGIGKPCTLYDQFCGIISHSLFRKGTADDDVIDQCRIKMIQFGQNTF